MFCGTEELLPDNPLWLAIICPKNATPTIQGCLSPSVTWLTWKSRPQTSRNSNIKLSKVMYSYHFPIILLQAWGKREKKIIISCCQSHCGPHDATFRLALDVREGCYSAINKSDNMLSLALSGSTIYCARQSKVKLFNIKIFNHKGDINTRKHSDGSERVIKRVLR